MSLSRLIELLLVCDGNEGGGGGRGGAGDESSTMGSELVPPTVPECILIPEGRLTGDSAAVNLRFLSEELRDGASLVGDGRAGSEYLEDEACDSSPGSRGRLRGCGTLGLTCRSAPDSLRKSIHVCPPYTSGSCARKCEATAPCG